MALTPDQQRDAIANYLTGSNASVQETRVIGNMINGFLSDAEAFQAFKDLGQPFPATATQKQIHQEIMNLLGSDKLERVERFFPARSMLTYCTDQQVRAVYIFVFHRPP